jgi:hypothetical protein
VLGQQRRIHRIGMIEVLLHPLFERHARIVFVVAVLLENDNVRFGKRFDNPRRNGGFAGAGAAADPDNQWTAIERTYGGCLLNVNAIRELFCARISFRFSSLRSRPAQPQGAPPELGMVRRSRNPFRRDGRISH